MTAKLKDKIFTYPNPPAPTTIEYYAEIYKTFSKVRNEIYICAPFTSGGVYRLYKDNHSSFKKEIFKTNGDIARSIAKELLPLFTKNEQVTLMLGSMDSWKQTDYNFFCLLYLSGISPKQAALVHKKLFAEKTIDIEVFNNASLPKKVRLNEYLKMVNEITKAADLKSKPVKTVLLFPDCEISLGCQAEQELAKKLKIPAKKVYFDTTYPAFSKSIYHNEHWKKITDADFVVPTITGKGNTLISLN